MLSDWIVGNPMTTSDKWWDEQSEAPAFGCWGLRSKRSSQNVDHLEILSLQNFNINTCFLCMSSLAIAKTLHFPPDFLK